LSAILSILPILLSCLFRLAPMDPDDELCLCFHVTRRKVENYIRLERPRRVGQLADCYGAGTGCGWCRPFLQRLFDAALPAATEEKPPADLPSAADYARGRSDYVRAGGGTPPPGATPIGDGAGPASAVNPGKN
jgi:NAD(P)H-nitrite reductase large subunit